jgi:hypothetical protein
MKAPHYLGEHDAKGFGWWFVLAVLAGAPAAASPNVVSGVKREVMVGFVREGEGREIIEADARRDKFVRWCRNLTTDFCGFPRGNLQRCTHGDTTPDTLRKKT